MQGCNRRSSNWRETNNLGEILTPPEVFTPALLAWMKQWGHEATDGVARHDPRSLMTVTTLARQGEIVVLRHTACLQGIMWSMEKDCAAYLVWHQQYSQHAAARAITRRRNAA